MSQHQKDRKIKSGETKGMINAYVCTNLHSMVTKNVDSGIIPQIVACPQCGTHSYSMNYKVNQGLEPQIEWFKPTAGEMQAAELVMTPVQVKDFRRDMARGVLMSRIINLEKLHD